MTFGYAAFTLMNSSPFDPEWPEAIGMAVKLLEREQNKLDNAEEVEYEEISVEGNWCS